MRVCRGVTAAIVAIAAASPAIAHSDSSGLGGFVAGVEHPLSGADHLLAMVSVGIWGAILGRPLLVTLPVVFPAMMAVGGLLGLAHVPLPPVEIGIALSVLLLGACIMFEWRAPVAVAVALVALFAIFHGYAHGRELPRAADPVYYSMGFMLATGLLHVVGIGIGLIHSRAAPPGYHAGDWRRRGDGRAVVPATGARLMRDGALPAIALCLMLGMMLAYSLGRVALAASALASISAIAASAVVLPLEWRTSIVIACWAATLLLAIVIYRARAIPMPIAVAAAALAGVFTGALTDQIGRPEVLAFALPWLLIQVPARWVVRRNRSIVLKVLASWIVAIALLSAGLTIVAGANSGSDHLD